MVGLEHKHQFDGLQQIFNCCIDRVLQVNIDKFNSETEFLDGEDLSRRYQDDFTRTTSELAEIYERYPFLMEIRTCFSKSDFFMIAEFLRLWIFMKRSNICHSQL